MRFLMCNLSRLDVGAQKLVPVTFGLTPKLQVRGGGDDNEQLDRQEDPADDRDHTTRCLFRPVPVPDGNESQCPGQNHRNGNPRFPGDEKKQKSAYCRHRQGNPFLNGK